MNQFDVANHSKHKSNSFITWADCAALVAKVSGETSAATYRLMDEQTTLKFEKVMRENTLAALDALLKQTRRERRQDMQTLARAFNAKLLSLDPNAITVKTRHMERAKDEPNQ